MICGPTSIRRWPGHEPARDDPASASRNPIAGRNAFKQRNTRADTPMQRTLVLVLLLILFCSGRSAAAPLAPAAVPEPLRPWVDWVLHDQPQRFCAPTPDNVQRRLCHWPARLELDADSEGARFEMEAVMLSPGWLELPGESARWPQQVRVNGQAHSVLDRGNVPAIWLDPGQYRVTGSLRWTTLPESLRLPAGAGVLHLLAPPEGVALS